MFKLFSPKFAIFIVIVIIAAVVGLGIYFNQPEIASAQALVGVIDDFADRDEIAPLTKVLSKGSIEFSATEFTSDGDAVLGEDFEAKGKLYFSSSKSAFMIEDLYLNYNDTTWGGNMYISPDKSYIKETEKLDINVGLVKGEVADDFADSVFAYGSDSDYEIYDEDAYNTIIEILEYWDDLENEKMAKDAKKIAKKYFKELWKIVCEYADINMRVAKVELNDGEKYAKVITINIDSETIADVMDDFFRFLEEDEDVVKFIEKYEGDLYDTISRYFDLEEGSIADLYEQFIGETNDNMDEIREDIIDSEYYYDLELVTNVITSKLLKLTVYSDSEQVFMLDAGSKGIEKSEKITAEVGGTKLSYEVSDYPNLKNVVMNVNGEELFKYKLNKNKDEYSFRIMNRVEFEGTIKSKIGKTTVTVEEIEVIDSESGVKTKYETDLTIVFDKSDRIPKADKDFDRISDYDQDDIDDLAYRIDE